jgi:hypothetical protein
VSERDTWRTVDGWLGAGAPTEGVARNRSNSLVGRERTSSWFATATGSNSSNVRKVNHPSILNKDRLLKGHSVFVIACAASNARRRNLLMLINKNRAIRDAVLAAMYTV